MSLVERHRGQEWMDQPGLDERLHSGALDGLRRINRYSGSARSLWSEIRQLNASAGSGSIRVLDIGCGGGDTVVALDLHARAGGIDWRFDGCDRSPFAVEYARRYANVRGARGVRFFRHDVLTDPLPPGYDFVVCSLFLHHFDESDGVVVLKRAGEAARRGVVVQDLRRTCFGYLLAWAGCRLLSRSRVVHTDGPMSVAGAFTPEEAAGLARRAGLSRIRVRDCWPQRFILTALSEAA